MNAPSNPGWYLIVRKDAVDQSSKVRASWDGNHFFTQELPGAMLRPSEVSAWEPIPNES